MSAATAEPEVTIPLDVGDHKAGCPAERVESYEATKPGKDNQPSTTVTVTRCNDCGGHRVRNADMATVIRALKKKGNTDGRKQQQQRPGQQPDAGQPDAGSGSGDDNPIE